jgi:hypothetical protein
MRFKKFEKPHKNAKFQAKRAVMKQDETVKTQIPTMKPLDMPKKADKAEKKAEEKPQTEEEAKTVALPIEDKAEKAEKAEDKPSYDPEIK